MRSSVASALIAVVALVSGAGAAARLGDHIRGWRRGMVSLAALMCQLRNGTTLLKGAIYAKSSLVTLLGNGSGFPLGGPFVVGRATISGGGGVSINASCRHGSNEMRRKGA